MDKLFYPFVGLDLSFKISDPGQGKTSSSFKIAGKLGGEYFFTERLSLNGAVLLGFSFGDETEIGTDSRIGLFYYFQ